MRSSRSAATVLGLVASLAACAHGRDELPGVEERAGGVYPAPPPEAEADLGDELGGVIADARAAALALDGGGVLVARDRIDAAVAGLDRIREDVPAGEVLRAIDDAILALRSGRPVDEATLAPLLRRVADREGVLDPAVLDSVAAAREAVAADRIDLAAARLEEAREALAEDVGAYPLERSRATLVAAREELAAGRALVAARLVSTVPPLLEPLEAAWPLLPVRWALRAAALAGERDEWDLARRYLTGAEERLEAMRLAQDAPLTQQVEELEVQVRTIADRTLGPMKPDPAEIRRLAQRATAVPAG